MAMAMRVAVLFVADPICRRFDPYPYGAYAYAYAMGMAMHGWVVQHRRLRSAVLHDTKI